MSRFEIGVKALILHEDKLLLLKRIAKPEYGNLQGTWDVPGGRLEFGESPEEGLRREVKEETGLEITRIHRIVDATTVYQDAQRQIVRLTFLCSATGDVQLGNEHTEHVWSPLPVTLILKDDILRQSLEKLTH